MHGSTVLLVAALAIGCGGTDGPTGLSYGENAEAAYEAAMEEFRDENCLAAEPMFRQVRREYPYSRFAALSELRLADCHLQQEKYAEAIQAYRQFVRSRPSHREVPYARFKIAESYFLQMPEDWFLSPPAYERDQGPTRDALEELRKFVLDFPEDERVPRAQRMVRDALAMLAEHELYVAEFYLDRDQPAAAVARLKTLLNSYMGSGLEPAALLMLGQIHAERNERDDARAAFEELVQRFPRSEEAGEAQGELREL
jgi:outer membrane protein assembly factor BamD